MCVCKQILLQSRGIRLSICILLTLWTSANDILIVTTVLSIFFGKIVFSWRFILNENVLFWLSIILSGTICLFYFCALFQIFTVKLILRRNMGLTLCNFYSQLDFFLINKDYFVLFFTDFKLLMFHNNILFYLFIYLFILFIYFFRNSEQGEHVENLPQVYLTYQCLHILQPFYYWEKMKIFDCFKTNV